MTGPLFLAIIITGGGYFPLSVEVLKSNGSSWCSLADLPEKRRDHSQSGLIACGGLSTTDTCVKFSNGTWTQSHDNLDTRIGHMSWSSSVHGTRLMGQRTTELLADNGKTPSSFPLKDFTS